MEALETQRPLRVVVVVEVAQAPLVLLRGLLLVVMVEMAPRLVFLVGLSLMLAAAADQEIQIVHHTPMARVAQAAVVMQVAQPLRELLIPAVAVVVD
jgi:hypothetical protein